MSNARSPRDVCSTTMGTSGLMDLAFLCVAGRDSFPGRAGCPPCGESSECPGWAEQVLRARSPELARPRLRLLALWSPQLVARLCLVDRDRLGLLGEQVERPARGDVSLQRLLAPGVAQALKQLGGCGLLALGRGRKRLLEVLVGGLDPLRLDNGGEDRLAPKRPLGVGLCLVDELVVVLAGDAQVGLLGDPLVAERVDHLVVELVRARVDEGVGQVDLRLARGGVEHRLAELGSDLLLLALAQAVAEVVAQLLERVEAGGVDGEVVVELGEVLALDLLDRDRELRRPALEVLGAVAVREGHRERALLARLGALELLLEALDEPAAAELDEL